MSKLNIKVKRLWANAIDKAAANYGYSQIEHELIDVSGSDMSKIEYRSTRRALEGQEAAHVEEGGGRIHHVL